MRYYRQANLEVDRRHAMLQTSVPGVRSWACDIKDKQTWR